MLVRVLAHGCRSEGERGRTPPSYPRREALLLCMV